MSINVNNLVLPKAGVVLAYYEGAYGPTVRIDTIISTELVKLKEMFTRIAQHQLDMLNLANIPGSTNIGIDKFILRRLKYGDRGKKSLVLKRTSTNKLDVMWSLVPLEWWGCVNLVDGLLDFGAPAHQYMNEDKQDSDDAIIELAYMESVSLRGLDE